MIYDLTIHDRNISDKDLIEDLVLVAHKYKKQSLTYSEYEVYGKYASCTIRRRFGSWKSALDKAGLKYTRKNCKNHECCVSEDDFIRDVKNVANLLGNNSVTYSEYQKYGKYDIKKMTKKLGGWNCVLQLAQLESTKYKTGKGKSISSKDLLLEIEAMWVKLGRQPTTSDVKKGVSKYSLNSYTRRFGSWNMALKTFVTQINLEKDDEEGDESFANPSTKENIIMHRTRREPSDRLKVQVLMRDGNRCRLCGVKCNDGLHNIHFDHIIPWSKGGETTLENLQVLCSNCNLAKGDID